MHTYIHTCLHTCIYTYIRAYIHTCIRIYIDTCIYIYIHAYIYSYMHIYIRAYIHTCIHIYIDKCILIYVHTCVHTANSFPRIPAWAFTHENAAVQLARSNWTVAFSWVKAHAVILGNELADQLAKAAAWDKDMTTTAEYQRVCYTES